MDAETGEAIYKADIDNAHTVYLTAEEEENKVIGQGNAPLRKDGSFIRKTVSVARMPTIPSSPLRRWT